MRPTPLTDPDLTVDATAQLLGVSTASVRNWVKTGDLERVCKGVISGASIARFKKNVTGQDKLTARANKSRKDTHDHKALQAHFQTRIKAQHTHHEDMGTQYELALSDAYRNKEGIYYTPLDVVERLFHYLPSNCASLTFCDPCCGSGNFIIAALKHGISPEHIYGYDTDPIAVEITKKRIFEKTGHQTKSIICDDFLKTTQRHEQRHFDIIFTNPPWGKKLTPKQKKFYAQTLGSGKSVDTSALFFFATLHCLNNNGYLGLLLPDAFFNIGSFEDARKKALSLTVTTVIDFGKPFKTLITKARGIVLQKHAPNQKTSVLCVTDHQQTSRNQTSFAQNPKSIFNISSTSEDTKVIDHLFSRSHVTLSDHAQYGLGIVTGNNKKFCRTHPQKDYIPVYTGKDISKDHLKKPTTFIPNDLSLYHQVAPQQLYQSQEKLMYRFISSHLVFYHDTDQSYFLNSVNMLVLNDTFPINTHQLGHILNSTVVNWLFQSLFETHKVLRSDLEALPIHTQYFDTYSAFAEETFLNYLGIENHCDGFRLRD